MKVLSIYVLKENPKGPPIILSSAIDLTSFGFFQRGSVQEVAVFVSREVMGRTVAGQRQSVTHQEYFCHVYKNSEGLGCAVLTDGEYPQRVAFSLIGVVLREWTTAVQGAWKEVTADANLSPATLEPLLKKYQNPQQADKIAMIEKDIDETKEILTKSIDQLLQRGEKLEELSERSEDLSFKSKQFVKNSENLNKCCKW